MRFIYISTLGFLLAMLVRKGFKAEHMYGACVARAVPCTTREKITRLREITNDALNFYTVLILKTCSQNRISIRNGLIINLQ